MRGGGLRFGGDGSLKMHKVRTKGESLKFKRLSEGTDRVFAWGNSDSGKLGGCPKGIVGGS